MKISPILKITTCVAALGLFATSVSAEEKSPWLIRLRAIEVMPDESSTLSIGGHATVNNDLVPELDITYFWTDHIATELVLGTTKHSVGAQNTAAGNLDLGHVWLLPPTLTAQYHFNPNGRIRPYVGAGINYTVFYSEDAGDLDTIEYDNSFGWAFQAGVDVGIDEHWAINADVKKLLLDTNVNVNNGLATADVDIDPWIFGLGLAYRF